ncbi:MAG TPA: hypothetical protein VNH40_06985 [Gaiellaceae bacterium]|nr:hypothetical protein [Gaiellaceae bacterium]
MIAENDFVDPAWKGVIRWGGRSLFAAGAIVVAFMLIVVVSQQTLPVPAKDMLEDPALPTALFALAAAGELLLMPGVLALYFALQRVGRTRMFVATALWLAAVPMFLAARGLIISVSRLSGSYADTTDATMRSAYLASAESAIEAQSILSAMGLILLSLATILVGWTMVAGVFDRRLAYVTIAAGVLTLPASLEVLAGLPEAIAFVGLVLGAVWQLIAGVKLARLGREEAPSRRWSPARTVTGH